MEPRWDTYAVGDWVTFYGMYGWKMRAQVLNKVTKTSANGNAVYEYRVADNLWITRSHILAEQQRQLIREGKGGA